MADSLGATRCKSAVFRSQFRCVAMIARLPLYRHHEVLKDMAFQQTLAG